MSPITAQPLVPPPGLETIWASTMIGAEPRLLAARGRSGASGELAAGAEAEEKHPPFNGRADR